jgi:cytosine/adenosine deaminase-related metal-dependent hydrolase
MRKFSADIIFTVTGKPIKKGTVITDDQGTILDVIEGSKYTKSSGVEYYDGIIIPGLINAHSHLEYSYTKGLIDPGGGLTEFIRSIILIKQQVPVDYETILQADEEMYLNGIVAVGDHTNTLLTKEVKMHSNIYYHSFIELYQAISEINSAKADFLHGIAYLDALDGQGSITPHAPYSVGPELMKMIANYAFRTKSIISIHNQETEGEQELFLYGSGKFADFIINKSDSHKWLPTGTSSIEWFLPFFRGKHNILLIHNTYTTKQDLEFALNTTHKLFWVMCPGSNLYIENQLPNIPMFKQANAKIALGTDSYASNTRLDIIYEMRILQENFDISFEELLQWATINGAEALGIDHLYGSIENGKKPGLVLLKNIDPTKLKLTENVTIERLI